MVGTKRKLNGYQGHAIQFKPPRKISTGRKYITSRRSVVLPGITRQSGYWGRFSGGRVEKKFHDVDLDDAVIAAVGTITDSINKIPQGVTEKTRIGRKAVLTAINWRYNITLPEQNAVATPVLSDTVRVIMYLDKQCNGATATIADGIVETANFQTFNNLANKDRFKILHDKLITINYTTLASHGFAADTFEQGEVQRNGSFYKKCYLPIEFDSTTGAITEIRSNNLGVLIFSKSGIAGFDSKIRLRFTDS